MRRRPERDGAWVVRWRDAQGGQKQRTFRARDLAESYARELATKRRAEGTRGITGISSTAWRDFQTLQSALGGATIAQLLAVWERHKHEVLGGDTRMTVGDAVTTHLASKKQEGISDVAYRRRKLTLERFVAFVGKETPLVSIDAQQVKDWLADSTKEHGLGVLAVRNYLKSLRAFFTRSMQEDWVTVNPAEKVPLPKEPKWEVSVLSAEDGAKLFNACKDEPISLRLALEAFGGLRYSSAARLEKADIRREEQGITLPADKHKSGRRQYLEGLPENLWHWIDRWWDDPRPWAMTQRQTMAAKSEAFIKAKVPHPANVLRHSFCSHHIALNQDAAKTAVLLQHTSPTMLYKHYKGVSSKADAARWFEINPKPGTQGKAKS